MCDCRERVEKELHEFLAKKYSEGRDHKVHLQGYAIVLSQTLSERPYMPYEATAVLPKKGGVGEKNLKERGNMFFSFCPFCGEKIVTA